MWPRRYKSAMTSTRKNAIAIIDDDAGMREAASTLLAVYGYKTETYDSAQAFLNGGLISEAACLVVDIQLGDISGLELARQLTADGYKHPIIFMTGLSSDSVRDQAAAMGAIAFLEKPFEPKLLLEAIRKVIR